MVLISGRNNMSRNVAIFWVLFSASLIFGNLYATVELEGKDRIDGRTRHQLLYVLTGVCAVATLMLVLLPASPRNSRDNKFAQTPDPHLGPLEALATTWNILWKKEILLLMITFIYAGFQQSFGQGIFGSCIGFTRQFGVQAKQLVPLSGLVYGVGDLVGGIGQAALNTVKSKIKCWSVVMVCLGYCCQAAAYIIVYLTIPNNAVFGESTELSVYPSRVWLALLASALLGLGDSCLNTQIFPLLAALQPNYSSQTCALYKFMKVTSN
ncbi:hypothetical protein AAG570_001127 [Ranatra chinensis]|uniref:UNC93-like protein MFSD11 n=1 Tax=Ranatra chinensis TaxID=642074 RepID=A0ABD0YAZ1_9HEMI